MEIVRRLVNDDIVKYFNSSENTHHISVRKYRDVIDDDKILYGYEINNNHRNGNEIHLVSENSLIYIYNKDTYKHITILIARPGQIRRYGINNECLLKKAYKNMLEGKNK